MPLEYIPEVYENGLDKAITLALLQQVQNLPKECSLKDISNAIICVDEHKQFSKHSNILDLLYQHLAELNAVKINNTGDINAVWNRMHDYSITQQNLL